MSNSIVNKTVVDVAKETHDATSKTTPTDTDELPLVDTAASNVLKKLLWSNIKATLKTYFDTLYVPITVKRTLQTVLATSGTVATGTTTIPLDNTIPQNTEGTEFLTATITPQSASSTLKITAQFVGANSAAVVQIAALFRDSTANAIVTSWESTPAGQAVSIQLYAEISALSTSATTFKIRSGGHSAGTTTFNGSASVGFMGGTLNSFIRIDEVL